METLRQRLAEQKGRHAGGSKWIGTGGTSPFGAHGDNPEGIRIGQEGRGSRSAVKVWDERSFRNLDGDVELNTRNIKIALRKLRRFAREGVPEELDLEGTIEGTARNAGYLDLHLVAERRNRVKVLLFLDVGGSMDPHVARLRGALLGGEERVPPPGILLLPQLRLRSRVARQRSTPERAQVHARHPAHLRARLEADLVGDAAMSPYEILEAGGSIEYENDEPGIVWLSRLVEHFRRVIWWNPEPPRTWEYTRSTQIVLQALGPRMFPLTLEGVARGIDALRH